MQISTIGATKKTLFRANAQARSRCKIESDDFVIAWKGCCTKYVHARKLCSIIISVQYVAQEQMQPSRA